jgi:hypothetical protein
LELYAPELSETTETTPYWQLVQDGGTAVVVRKGAHSSPIFGIWNFLYLNVMFRWYRFSGVSAGSHE